MSTTNRSQRNLFLFALSILIFVFASVPALAQDSGEIRGSIIDVDRESPLVGANVLLQGTTMGSTTNLEGTYSIRNVPPGTYTVIARFVGYRQQRREVTVAPNETVTLDFALSQTAVQFDEVIVTGQATARDRRELSVPVQSLSVGDIEASAATSIDQLLQGRVPGLVSLSSSGSPGRGARIRTRGITSAFASQTPVIYIDGVRVDNQDNFALQRGTGGEVYSALADILVENIERVEVIPGGAAATLFGSDASSGIIQIFTKKGVQGAPRWTFGTRQGVDFPETQFVIEDFTEDELLRSVHYQEYRMGVTGGTDAATYNLSGRIQESDGIVRGNDSRFYNLSGGLRTSVFDQVGIEFSANYTNSFFGGMFNNNAIASPIGATEDRTIQDLFSDNPDSVLNVALSPQHEESVNRFSTSLTGRYAPYQAINTSLTIGLDYRKNEQRIFNPIESEIWTSTPGGGIFRFDREYLSITLDWRLSYDLPLRGALSGDLTVGVQGFREEDRQSQLTGTDFPVPGTDQAGNATNRDLTEQNVQLFSGGFFGQLNFGLWDRLYFDTGLRVDENTAFGEDLDLQAYPKFGVAYNISDEAFWSSLKPAISEFRLRASWGQTGRFPPAFTRDRTFNAISFLELGGVTFDNPGDPRLKPERTTTIEFGADAGFLDDRIGLEFSWFQETTSDALFAVAQSPTTGFFSQLQNVGEIENTGVEVALRAVPYTKRNFEWSFRASYAYLDNEVTDLGGTPPFSIGGFAFLPMRIEEGHPVGTFRLNIPVPDEDGEFRGDFLADQLDGRSPTPKHTGSFSTNLRIARNFELNAVADYAFDAHVLNTGAVIRFFNSVTPGFDIPEDDFSQRVPEGYSFATASEVWVEETNWVKIREISARYRVPQSVARDFGIRGLSFDVSLRNVATITNIDTFDPELHGVRAGTALDVGGINFFTLSPPRELRFGINLTL